MPPAPSYEPSLEAGKWGSSWAESSGDSSYTVRRGVEYKLNIGVKSAMQRNGSNVWRRVRPRMPLSSQIQPRLRFSHHEAFEKHTTRSRAARLTPRRCLAHPTKPGRLWHRRLLSSAASATPKALINDTPNQEILLELESGEAGRYPSFWLRDHCLCEVCSHPSTHQRQHDTFTLNEAIKASTVSSTPEGLRVTWTDADSHESLYPWDWLSQHSPFPTSKVNATTRHQSTRAWTPFLARSPKPQTPYPSLMASDPTAGQRSLFANIHKYGLAFLPETPPTPAATIDILNTLGPIRHTHYGGFWDFTSEVNPIDTAYTNLSLPLHTDNTYFTDPAGLQLFHLLSHMPSTCASPQPGDFDASLGGQSTFADGFAAADALYRTDKPLYHILSTTPIVFAAEGSPAGAFRNNRTHIIGNPVFTHADPGRPSTFSPSTLTQVRWNNCDRSPLTTFASHSAMLQWFKAARLWDEILRSWEFEVEVKLRPGEPVVFDNWRILHGRRAFEGKRRMCGAYTGMDDFRAGAGRLGVF